MDQLKLEQEKLNYFLEIIRENLRDLRERKASVDAEAKELYDAYTKGDTELYSAMMVAFNLQDQVNSGIEASEAALEKPYFGRVDYLDRKEQKSYSLYIGKHGISKGVTEVLIVDWRAAAASIYYECGVGEGSYRTPEEKEIPIRLDLKRSFDMEKGKLLGFYDSDTVANDELLVKYLTKNKDTVLGEIIATIQKEQDCIIRERHNRSLIVQGVAGSGKTTVAVHRISYLMYNYADKYSPEEYCVIGSNDMLLNYITSALPGLDVRNTRQYRMDRIFLYFIAEWFPQEKYIPYDSGILTELKASCRMADLIEQWTKERQEELIPREELTERGQVLFPRSSIDQYLDLFQNQSITRKIENLNTRLSARIKLVFSEEEPPVRKEISAKYRKYFSRFYKKKKLTALYPEFIGWLRDRREKLSEEGISDASLEAFEQWTANVKKGRLDVYDLAAMTLIANGWLRTEEETGFRQIIIDEAQDFGAFVYYVLHKQLPDAVYMIMGDVSQNIHFNSGMNDWRELRSRVFNSEQDRFYTLCKSYRNTTEISAYASRILARTSFETYPIEPIVRHGAPVAVERFESEQEMADRANELLAQIRERGYETIAVICREEQEAHEVRTALGLDRDRANEIQEQDSFYKGVMVLPVALTKGLEFDGVILWNPDVRHYADCDGDAKLLYVAVTRALHELHILHTGQLCGWLEE